MKSKQSKVGGSLVEGAHVYHTFYILIMIENWEINLLWTLSRHDALENANWSMQKQKSPGCKDVLRKETILSK